MRGIALATFLIGSIPFVLWRPAVGVLLWIWVSVMSPHRLTWGFAHDFRWAYLIAVATLVGLVVSREPRRLPVTPVTAVLALMVAWMTLSTCFAIDIPLSMRMWERVMKIVFMVFIALYVLHSKRHVQALIWVVAGSIAFYGVKGGLFTLAKGAQHRVYGPPGSFIEENNALALATIMTIPLLYYAVQRAPTLWARWGLAGAMVLCGFSVLGSHSRGGLIALVVMLAFLWWQSRGKWVVGVLLGVLVAAAIVFMPAKWVERMQTIAAYEQDASAMARVNAWEMAYRVASDRPLGGGFDLGSAAVFARYARDPSVPHAAHSIYFQVLGEHGFAGLGLYLLLWILVWRDTAWIIRRSGDSETLGWASDLARMIQVSLVGFFVAGAFLSLAYYDVPYNLLVAVVLTRGLVEAELWPVRYSSAR
ncbi:MAG: putative O-glycosylation ligase, exosortase A system-associated [Deltaproteobacteria bacterium]|nr:putative O-glycosylation ligase, exosortase A system-associated [Deltaproteobacteria bacterium]